MEFLISILAGICVALLFSLAIFIHELGHFLVARWLGLQVDTFSIGFGPALWRRTVNGIEYKICALPLGGYVALPQLDPSGMEKIQGDHTDSSAEAPERQLEEVAPWKRIAVSLSGPLGNVILGIALAFLISALPQARTGVTTARVGTVVENSQAWELGLRPGDQIVGVNGRKVSTWPDLQVEWQLAGDSGSADFEILRGTERVKMTLPLVTNNIFGIKLLADVYPETGCEIGQVVENSVAASSGLQPGDQIVALDGEPVSDMYHFIDTMGKRGDQPAELTIERQHEQFNVAIRPRYDAESERWLLGIIFSDKREQVKPWMMYRNPWHQLQWDSLSVVRVLKALVVPEVRGERKAVAKNIGGPVAIVVGLYNTVRGNFIDGLGFLRMICINLAILNLLPLPVLDGGHIVFALYEIITRRKPHPRVVAVLVNTFAIILIGLMLLLVYSDIAKKIKYNQALRSLEQSEQTTP